MSIYHNSNHPINKQNQKDDKILFLLKTTCLLALLVTTPFIFDYYSAPRKQIETVEGLGKEYFYWSFNYFLIKSDKRKTWVSTQKGVYEKIKP